MGRQFEKIEPNWKFNPRSPGENKPLFQTELRNQRDVRPKIVPKRKYSITSDAYEYLNSKRKGGSGGGGMITSATYKLTVIVSHVVDPASTVTQTPAGTTFPAGTNVVLTPVPSDAAYVFDAWTGDVLVGHTTDNPLTIIMNSGMTITATFKGA